MIYYYYYSHNMNLDNIDKLPDDLSNLIYSKIIYNQPKELLTDIRNFKKSKERLKIISTNDIICNLCELDYAMVNVPKIIKTDKYNKQYDSNKNMMINLCLAKHSIDIRNKLVYDILQNKNVIINNEFY